ncbi:MAG: YoaK family protein [Luteolibacter sp.]|uniref:YoaK family protein n=1 Tax=Luteolibacter sp. TaxID=1962973 RepID=UPI0032669F5E
MTIQPNTRWIIGGGCCLAFLGAAVNACFLLRLGTSVSHLTGDVSKVAMNAVEGRSHLSAGAINLLTAAIGFVMGAATSGYFIHHPGIEFDRPYGRSIIAIGVCLAGAHFSFNASPSLSIILASFACGFQNALATHYRGMVLRTTHVTGLLTDLGTHLGMRLRGHEIARWKLLIPTFLVLSFFAGALFGTALVVVLKLPALLILAGIYIAGGTGWTLYKHLHLKGGST